MALMVSFDLKVTFPYILSAVLPAIIQPKKVMEKVGTCDHHDLKDCWIRLSLQKRRNSAYIVRLRCSNNKIHHFI